MMWQEKSNNLGLCRHVRASSNVCTLSEGARLCAQNVQNEFRGRGGQHAYNTIMLHTQPSIPSSLKFKWAAPEMVEGALLDDDGGEIAMPSMPLPLLGALCSHELMPEALLLVMPFQQAQKTQSRLRRALCNCVHHTVFSMVK